MHTGKSPSHVIAKLALAGLSVLPLSARAQEGSSNGQKTQNTTADPAGKLTDPFQDSKLSLPLRKTQVDLPQRVLDKAAMMNIDPTTIKLEQGKWLECTDKGCTLILAASQEEIQKHTKPSIMKGLRVGDNLAITGHQYSTHRVEKGSYGIPKFGNFTPAPDGTVTFTPHPEFTGTVTAAKLGTAIKQAPATNAKTLGAEVTEVAYSKEAMSKIHDRFMLELDTTFVFVISVPSQCPPCRTYKSTIKELAKQYPPDSKVVFLTVNFDTFDQAGAVVGPVKLFPTTVILPALKPNTAFSYVDDPNWQNKPFFSTIQRPGYKQGGSQQQAPLRALISKTLGVVETGLRGVTESLSQLLGAGR